MEREKERISMVRQRSPPAHGETKIIQAAIMGAIGVVFIGYILICIMMPTRIYLEHWSTKIISKTKSTYFGTQGSNILVYTFPILLIAVLGAVYLYLGEKEDDFNIDRNSRKQRLGSWKRPVIIKGLGIVSWIELAFFIMFIALLVWTFSAFLHFFFVRMAYLEMPRGHNVLEEKLESVAIILGIVGNTCLTFLFFPVTRGSSVLPLFGLTSEASIKYHIWLGHIAMVLFSAHGVLYIIYWVLTDQLSEMVKWGNTSISNLAGELSLLSGLVLWVTTYPSIRKKMFELFFYTHHLYILFIIFFIFHLGIDYSFIMLPGFYLFLVDRYLRFLQSRQKVRLISARILPSETVELNLSKNQGLNYTPTSIVFINVPSISKLQWHPFTISSSCKLEPNVLSIIIKREGSWTKELYEMLASTSSIDRFDVCVEGPYGPVSTNFLRHEKLVMVSGGSGISPFISIIRELISINSTLKLKTPNLLLISAFKNSSDLTMLDLLLPTTLSKPSNIDLEIEAYITREKSRSPQTQKPLRTIWFKPNPSDVPIAPILGRNGRLWLGVIISLSFIIFLLVIGVLTRYYIYPIDHNTGEIYSYSLRAMLNMLLICISLVMTASVVFIWNKKKIVMETKHMQEEWLDNGERELESIPELAMVKSTKVHYGQRPDLKRILSECKGSSVGVLVCGPKTMRHTVAGICSSRSLDNLHFESISFNW